MNNWDQLDVLEAGKTGELKENPSIFNDFWGTLINTEFAMNEDEESGRFYRQAVDTIKIDDMDLEVTEKYNLPTDPKTGEALRNEDGSTARPNKNSKWGVQEGLYAAMQLPWEQTVAGRIGIHGHWIAKGTRLTRADIAAGKKSPKGEPVYGRYMVEWDRYNNDIRKQFELPAKTETKESLSVPVAVEEVALPSDPEAAVVMVANGKTYLEFLKEVRAKHPSLADVSSREHLERLVEKGMLQKEQTGDGAVVYKG